MLAGLCSPWRLQGRILSSSLWCSLAFLVYLGLQLQYCCLCLWGYMVIVLMSVWVCSHTYVSHVGLRVTLLQCDLILTWLHLQRPCFQIRSYSQVSCLGLKHTFWGATIQSTTPSIVGSRVEISENFSDLVVMWCFTPWLAIFMS